MVSMHCMINLNEGKNVCAFCLFFLIGSTAHAQHMYFHNFWPTSQPQIQLKCNGSEIRLVDCQHSNQTCFRPYYAASIYCQQGRCCGIPILIVTGHKLISLTIQELID